MGSKFSLEAILSLTDNLTGPYKNTTRKITGMNAGLSRSFNKLNAGINRGLKRIAQVGLVALGAGIAFSTREFIRLDDAITKAGAKFQDMDVNAADYKDRLKELSTAARDVGKITEFSAVDAAGALDKMAMAGLTAKQSMALLLSTTNLASVADTDLTTSVDIATDALGAFGLMVEDTGQLTENLTRINDVFAKTSVAVNTDLEQLFETVKKGGPAMTAAGQELETFAAIAGRMASAGIKASQSGTAIATSISRLAKNKEALNSLAALGVQVADNEGNFRNMIDVLADIENATKTMGSQQRAATVATIFGDRAWKAFLPLLEEGIDKTRDLETTLFNAAGASKTMAEAMRQSLGNRLKVIKSGLTEIGLKFIEAFEEKGRGALDKLIIGIQNFDVQPIVDGVLRAVEVIEKWGPLLLDLAPWILGVVGAIKALNLAMHASPIGIFVASVAGLIGALELFEKKFGFGQKIVDEAGGGIFSREFEENRRARFAASERGQKQQETREAASGDPRFAVTQEAVVQETFRTEESKQRMDLFFNLPQGASISDSSSGAPLTGVSLGTQ